MSRTHRLKTWTEFFQAVLAEDKTFEFRRDDRGFMVGDTLALEHWDPGVKLIVGHGDYVRVRPMGKPETAFVDVKYILHGGRFGVPEGFCVMGIELLTTNVLPDGAEDS